MATLENKKNREVKVIIPNMREFRTFYSDNEGVIGIFFKRDWEEETTKKEEHWKPSEEQMEAFKESLMSVAYTENKTILESLYEQLKEL